MTLTIKLSRERGDLIAVLKMLGGCILFGLIDGEVLVFLYLHADKIPYLWPPFALFAVIGVGNMLLFMGTLIKIFEMA